MSEATFRLSPCRLQVPVHATNWPDYRTAWRVWSSILMQFAQLAVCVAQTHNVDDNYTAIPKCGCGANILWFSLPSCRDLVFFELVSGFSH
jgi:hypothetical protein